MHSEGNPQKKYAEENSRTSFIVRKYLEDMSEKKTYNT